MVEPKLESLLSAKYQLGAEFTACHWKNIDHIEEDMITFFKSNSKYNDFFHQTHAPLSLEETIKELLPLAMAYVYYFGYDYLFRTKMAPTFVNSKFIKDAFSNIKPEKEGDESDISVSKIYAQYHSAPCQNGLKELITFLDDPLHANPRLVINDYEKDNKYKNKRIHFNGQIPYYFSKTTNKIDMTKPLKERCLVTDPFPAIFIIAFYTYTALPLGSYAQDGSLSVNQLLKLADTIKQYLNSAKPADFPFYSLSDQQSKLLHQLCMEDLFRIERLDVTLHAFNTFCKNTSSSEKEQRSILAGLFPLLYYAPSSALAQKYSNNIIKAADFLLNKNIDDCLQALAPLINVNHILFPQMIMVLLYSFYTKKDFSIKGQDSIKYALQKISPYIDKHSTHIEQLISDNQRTYFWNKEMIPLLRNKGSKDHPKQQINYIFKDSPNIKLSFENITGTLIASDLRWRYTTIIEANRAITAPGQMETVLGAGPYGIPEIQLIKHYTSQDFFTLIQYNLLKTLGISHNEIVSKEKCIRPYRDTFSLLDF